MNMKKIFVLFVIAAVISSSVWAQVPQTISYQGFYTDASGNPVTGGPHKIAFKFLDAASSVENTGLAREVENVTINKGIISVVIGGGDPSNTTAPDNAPLPLNVWTQAFKIQVFVDGSSIGAAVPLTTVPYAFIAGSVDGANISGTMDASKVSGILPGAQVGTGISATNISSGTIADARLESTLDVTAVNTSGNISAGGAISGNGSGLTTLNASNISSGTLASGRLATNIDVAGRLTTVDGLHVGSATAPGADNLEVDGYTKLGGSGVSITTSTPVGAVLAYPAIRILKITGTCAGDGGTAQITLSGLAEAKILNIDVIVEFTAGDYIHAGYTNTAGLQFNYFYNNGVLNIKNITGNSASLAARPFKAIITYEE
jgi:hypothetical protein